MIFLKHNENAARRNITDFPISKRIKFLAGSLLGKVFQKRRSQVAQAPFANDSSRLNRLIRNGIYAEAFNRKDHPQLREYFSYYWGQEAAAFHEGWNDRFDRMFLAHDVRVIDDLETLIQSKESEGKYKHLYEIGCGGGQVLDYLHKRFPQLESLTGIDLGASQIEKNRDANTSDSMHFEAADANSWIPKHAKPGCILLTNGGVFEYFLQEELESLFEYAATNLKPVAICIIETIGTDHDLDTEFDSLIYGRELAFSHNYPHLLKKAGFSIISSEERAGEEVDGGGRWIRTLAVKS